MAKTHRILQLIIGLGVGGAEVALLRSSRELKKRGHELRVISLKRINSLEGQLRVEDIAVFYFTDLIKSPKLLKELRAWHAEILVAWMPAAHLTSIALKKILGIKHLIWNVRQTLNRRDAIPAQTWLIIKTCARLSHSVDGIIYNSERGAIDHQTEGYFADRQVVIPNGFSIPKLPSPGEIAKRKQTLNLSLDRPVITFVGRNHPDKGSTYFIHAALEFLKGSKAHFLIAGSGFENVQLPENVKPNFHFLGTVDESKLNDIYSVTDIFTSSSVSEGFSNAIGEAMSHAVYPVVTNVGDSEKIIGKYGSVVPPSDAAAIRAAWSKFLTLPTSQQADLRQGARERIVSEYSLANVIKKYEDLFDAVTEL